MGVLAHRIRNGWKGFKAYVAQGMIDPLPARHALKGYTPQKAGRDLKAAMGTLYTMKGDYNSAKTAYGNEATNNAAVQQILNEDYAAARQTLARVANPNATTAYLAAVVGARTNDREAVYSNLKVAVQRNTQMKAKAQADIEFAKYQADEQFQAIVK